MIKYLRFEDESQAKSVLVEFVQGGEWVIASHAHSLDLIGPLLVNEETMEIDTRFHVNFQGEMQADVSQYEVQPTNPRRVWA